MNIPLEPKENMTTEEHFRDMADLFSIFAGNSYKALDSLDSKSEEADVLKNSIKLNSLRRDLCNTIADTLKG